MFIGFFWMVSFERTGPITLVNGSSGRERRVGMTIYGKGTGFQAVGGNVAENNLDSKRHVTSVPISSRVQQACAASRLSRGALWAVGYRKPLHRNLKNSRCPPSPALISGSGSLSAARPSGNVSPQPVRLIAAIDSALPYLPHRGRKHELFVRTSCGGSYLAS